MYDLDLYFRWLKKILHFSPLLWSIGTYVMPVRQKITEQKDRVFCVEITDEAGLCQIKGEWEELFEDSVSANAFATWDWTYLWWKNFSAAHSGTYLHLLVHAVYEKTGRLIGVAPLYYGQQRRNRVRYRGLHEIGHANIHAYV